jgi:hypothetical protein
MNNRDVRDTEPREKKEYEMRTKMESDMSWLLPALIGLIVIGAVAYYLLRRPKVEEKPALPAPVTAVTTHPATTVTTPATPAVPATR